MNHSHRFRRLIQCALIALICAPLLDTVRVDASSPLVIGEVAWAGSSLSTADEWVELWNLGDTDLSLEGYALLGASDQPIFFPPTANVPAHGTYLVSNYSESDPKSVLATTPNAVTTTISLSNSALLLSLIDPNGVVVNQVGDGKTPPTGSSGTIKSTMIREGETWENATTAIGIDSGVSDLGTPGICDDCIQDAPSDTQPVDSPSPISTSPESPTASTDTVTTTTDPSVMPPEITTTSTPASPSTELPTIEPAIITTSTSPTSAIEGTNSIPTSTDPIEPIHIGDLITSPSSSSSPTAETFSTAPTTSSSSTIELMPEDLLPSPEESTDQITSNPTTEPVSNSQSTSTSVPSPRYDLLRLNEIMPQPNGEAEWIEITSLDPSFSVSLNGVHLHDATGNIYTFTQGALDAVHSYLRVILSSSRFNNDGDTVKLVGPNGGILDALVYTDSQKGITWGRSPDGQGIWKLTSEPTPDEPNMFPPEISETNTPSNEVSAPSESAVTNLLPASSEEVMSGDLEGMPEITKDTGSIQTMTVPTSTASLIKTPSSTTSTGKVKKVTPKTAPKPSAVFSPSKTLSRLKTTNTKSPTSKKTSTASKLAVLPKPLTFAMAQQEENAGIRVTLQGIVGSPSSLLTSHAFILLAADGRGLLVHVPTNRKLPTIGQTLKINGTLTFNDSNVPSLKVGKNDGWTSIDPITLTPRLVDLVAPSTEDAWSFVQVTGTVQSIKGSTATLDLGDATISVLIRPVVNYRTARLAVGDTIRIQGVLDTRREDPILLPRQSSDIEIVKHVEPKNSSLQSTATLPSWTPFGAAGIAIAGTEGIKQLRHRFKQRTLEKILKTGLNAS